MQTITRPPSHLPASNADMASDISAMFSSTDEWTSAPGRANVSGPPARNYLDISLPDLPATDGQYTLQTVDSHDRLAKHDRQDGRVPPGENAAFEDFGFSAGMQRMPTTVPFAPPSLYSSQPAFTAANTQTISAQDPQAISSMQPRLDRAGSAFSSDASFTTDGTVQSATSIKSMPWSETFDGGTPPQKRRCNSLKDDYASEEHNRPSPSPAGRQRRSENVEPGSARAIYLEKNRKAASKCRTKQKKQQEELVETARDVERKNKALKAEVEILKGGMRELMELVGQHTDCPDARLRTYVQREADRLAAGGVQPPAYAFTSLQHSTASPAKS